MKEAEFYRKLDNKKVICDLCPKHCVIEDGKFGKCGARKNIGGKLYSLVYGKISAMHVDPIEKKPFYHFLPGTKALSISTVGCNLSCLNCQNYDISQVRADEVNLPNVSPEEVVEKATELGVRTIAYTYNEPTIFFEYAYDIMKLAHKEGIKNVFVSNGYIERKPLIKLTKFLDAANIDLKFFDDKKYVEVTTAHLKPVLNTLELLKEKEVWLEITNLLIPGYNDDEEEIREMINWISKRLGRDTVIHFSRFFPMYRMTNILPTPLETMREAFEIAKEKLNFVYAGNIPHTEMDNTYCPKCGRLLVERVGFKVIQNNIVDGKCKFCGEKIPGVFSSEKD